jgi:V-type H+-transporting ATPase subunit D
LKKVQGKKKRDAALADASKAIENTETADVPPKDETATGPSDLLNDKDDDVIF